METLKREKATVESLQYLLYSSGLDNLLYHNHDDATLIKTNFANLKLNKKLILHAWSCFDDTNNAIEICRQNRQFYF